MRPDLIKDCKSSNITNFPESNRRRDLISIQDFKSATFPIILFQELQSTCFSYNSVNFQIINLWFLQDWFPFSVFIHPALQQSLFRCYGDKLLSVLWFKNEAKTFLFVFIRRLHIQKIMEDPYLFPDLSVNPTNRVAFQPRNHANFDLHVSGL